MRLLLALVSVVAGGAIFELVSARRDARRFPAPGRLIKVRNRHFHVYETGEGSVPVLLEAGLSASSISWRPVQERLSPFSRVVSYDRAGLGWSSSYSGQVQLPAMLEGLHAVIEAVAPNRPVILVGHSFGALLTLAFATKCPHRVLGLVLVDPVSIRQWGDCSPNEYARLRLGARLARRGAWLARIGIVRVCLSLLAAGSTRLPQWIARASAGRGTSVLSRLTGELKRLPASLWPVILSQWSRPRSFLTLAGYLDALPRCAAASLKTSVPAGVPVIVLSAGTATSVELEERENWIHQSGVGEHHVLPHCSHWIQLQAPEAVVESVCSLLARLPPNPR